MRVASEDANERVRFFYIVEEGMPAGLEAGLDKLKVEWRRKSCTKSILSKIQIRQQDIIKQNKKYKNNLIVI